MKIKDETSPKTLIRRLVDQANEESLLLELSRREHWRETRYYMPGGMIESLSPTEREAIKNLTVDDCQNLRVDGISWKLKKDS